LSENKKRFNLLCNILDASGFIPSKERETENKNVDFRLRPLLALPRALDTKEIFIQFSQFSPGNLEIEMDYREFIFMAFVFCYQFVGSQPPLAIL
jgi:hypothetical protein